MKKILLLYSLLLFVVFSLFCQEVIPGRSIFIDGTAPRSEQMVFFLSNFNMEIDALGYNVVGSREEADYIFKFYVIENQIMYADGISRPAPAGEPRWFVQISLIIKKTNVELISFSFPFTELEEMYEYNQYLFYRVMINIPVEGTGGKGSFDTRWQNKLLYFSLEADYRLSYFQLKDYEKQLYQGAAAYIGDKNSPIKEAKLDNIIYGLASITVGVEYQFLNFLSIEGTFGVYLGDPVNYGVMKNVEGSEKKKPNTDLFFNFQAGVNIKYNFKRPSYVLSPYAGYNYTVKRSPVYSEFPVHSWLAGTRITLKATTNSAFFINLSYQYFLGDVKIDLKDYFSQMNVPNAKEYSPEFIHYKHFTLSIGAGYKYGFFDKKKK